jgi:hypothetical protein
VALRVRPDGDARWPAVSDAADFVFLTHAVEAVRTTMLHDQVIGTGGWAWLVGTALAWLALGVATFARVSTLSRAEPARSSQHHTQRPRLIRRFYARCAGLG